MFVVTEADAAAIGTTVERRICVQDLRCYWRNSSAHLSFKTSAVRL
jgi:hypothetical protein